MEVDFKERMDDLVRDLEDAIQDMDLSDETYTIGENNIQGLISGTASMKRELTAEYAEMGRAAMEAYKREVDQHSPSKKFMQMGSNDIQGIIEGVEREKASLAAAYEESAQAALRSMERAMPSTFRVPQAVDNRTAAPADTVSNRWEDVPPIQIHVDRMEVRKEGTPSGWPRSCTILRRGSSDREEAACCERLYLSWGTQQYLRYLHPGSGQDHSPGPPGGKDHHPRPVRQL